MTVDEITAEVESRRASKSIDQDMDDWTQVNSGDELDDDTMEDTLNEEADSEEEEAEEATYVDDDDDDQPKRITSRGGKCQPDYNVGFIIQCLLANKWIKGALIGAGSFGKVYLGMDASNGLLMAVKQVELPTGSAPNQERKKSMLNALEREIELLKNLQHVNIVQYLCS
jgi:mitogen-activated protein kinase kinase kinase